MMWVLPLLTTLAATPSDASCAEGKLKGPDTAGRCCWPGQAWSSSRQACVGIPQCPAGLTAQGEDCQVACPPGQAVGPDTAGHCCWPSQVWSRSRQVCVGLPQCPGGMLAQAESCVAEAQVAAPPPASAPPPPAAPPPPPDAARETPATSAARAPLVSQDPAPEPRATMVDGLLVPQGHRVVRKARLGLLVPGVALLGGGWLISVLVSIGGGIYSAVVPRNTCWGFVAQTGWIPLIGPPIAIGGQGDPSLHHEGGGRCTEPVVYPIGLAIAVVDTAMQWAGLTMMILGLTVRQSVVVPDEPAAHRLTEPEWYVNLGAPGSPLGVSVGLRGF